MRYLGDIPGLKSNADFRKEFSRAEIAKAMAAAPPASEFLPPDDVAFLAGNADLVREDYAEVLADLSDATSVGKRRKMMHLGIGAVAGLVVGALGYKLIGG